MRPAISALTGRLSTEIGKGVEVLVGVGEEVIVGVLSYSWRSSIGRQREKWGGGLNLKIILGDEWFNFILLSKCPLFESKNNICHE